MTMSCHRGDHTRHYDDPLQFLIPLKILGSFSLILLISLLGMLTTSSAERSQPSSSLQSSDLVQSHNSHTWLSWTMAQATSSRSNPSFPEPLPATEEPDQHKSQPWCQTFFNYTKLTPPLAQDSAGEVSRLKALFLIKDYRKTKHKILS